MASRLASAILSLGVTAGDRVVVQLPNWHEFAIVYLAVSRVGAIVVPVQPIYRANEIRYVIDRTDAKLGFWTPQFRSHDHLDMQRSIRPSLPSLSYSILIRADQRLALAPHELRFEDLAGDAEDLTVSEVPAIRPSADDGHLIGFTSGTESRPKGCYHTFNTYAFCARELAKPEFMDVGPHSSVLMPSPITHTTGLNTGIIMPLLTGARTVLMDTWDPATALEDIGTHRCTHGVGAPPFLRTLLDAYAPSAQSLESMRVWL
jgi:cyclohexanecarboxylate-CoA ligase/acyl-CoA synthetase